MQVAPSAQLGDDTTIVDRAAHRHAGHVSANSQGPVANVVPEYAALGMPFLFSSRCRRPASCWTARSARTWPKKFEAKDLILLAWWDNGIRQMTNNKRPITKVDDLKGLKMRTPADPDAGRHLFQALGASTQQIKFAELYVALQQGVVDGQENPLVQHPRQQALRSAEVPRADEPPVRDDAVPDEQAQLGQAVRGRQEGGAGGGRARQRPCSASSPPRPTTSCWPTSRPRACR